MNIVSDRVLYGSQFVECATGNYYFNCSTWREINGCYWNGVGTPISKKWKLTDVDKIPKDAYVAIVQVSKENDYTDYEYYFVRLHKKIVDKFIERMNEEWEE